jgi:LysM repeat protein
MSYRLKALLIVSLLVVMMLPLGTSFAVDSCTQVHTVVTGETLYRISLRYNVSMATLQAEPARPATRQEVRLRSI